MDLKPVACALTCRRSFCLTVVCQHATVLADHRISRAENWCPVSETSEPLPPHLVAQVDQLEAMQRDSSDLAGFMIERMAARDAQTRAAEESDGQPERRWGEIRCQLSAQAVELLETNQAEGEFISVTLIRAIARTRPQLVEFFNENLQDDMAGGFVVERNLLRRQPKGGLVRKTFRISQANIEGIAALMAECQLGSRYSPLVEQAILFAFGPDRQIGS